MAVISGGVTVGGFIAPSDSADTYGTHHEDYGIGGFRSVADLTARDAIPTARRKQGMLVKVLATNIIYELASNLTTWHGYIDSDRALLEADMIAGATPSNTPTATGDLGTVVYTLGGSTIRTDVYTYDASNNLTSVRRTLANGKYITITFPSDGSLPYASDVQGGA